MQHTYCDQEESNIPHSKAAEHLLTLSFYNSYIIGFGEKVLHRIMSYTKLAINPPPTPDFGCNE